MEQVTRGRPPKQPLVLQHIPRDNWVQPSDIKEDVDVSKSGLYKILKTLLELGKVERKLSFQDTRVKLYRRVA